MGDLMPNTTILISKLIQKQMRIVAGAAVISIVVVVSRILESRSILPNGISITALYSALLFIWPCISSVSGALIPSCTVRQSTQTNPGGLSKRIAALFLQLIAAIFLAIIGVAAALGVLPQISMEHQEANLPRLSSSLTHFVFDSYFGFPSAGGFSVFNINSDFKWQLGIFVSLVCFACALLFSSLLSRTRPAAAAGLVSGLSVSCAIIQFGIRLDLPIGDFYKWAFGRTRWILSMLTLAMLLIFFLAFILRSNRNWSARKTIFSGSLLCAGSALIVFFAFAYPRFIRLSPRTAFALYRPFFSADGKTIIVTAAKIEGFAPQIWGIPVNGKGIRRLTGRLAATPITPIMDRPLITAPFISPDGNWIGYFSRRSFLGLVQDHLDLRIVRVDGTQDRLLISRLKEAYDTEPQMGPEIACSASAFSPDGSRIAVFCKDVLTVVELKSGHCINITLPLESSHTYFDWNHTDLAWNHSGSEIFISMSEISIEMMGSGPLLACDPATGQIRTIRENPRGINYAFFLSTARGMRFVLIGNSLLDLQTNKEQPVKYYQAWISSDEKVLVYATPHSIDHHVSGTEFHWQELPSGKKETVAIFPNNFERSSFYVSPSGDRVVINGDPAIVMERTGAMRFFPHGWSPFGWAGNGQVGLYKPQQLFPLALGDAETMKLRIINP
jgi:hypothetical protein